MNDPIQRAQEMIDQRDTRIRNQIASINRLLDEWRQLQDWISEEMRNQDVENELDEGRVNGLNDVLIKMAEIRVKDAKHE